MWKWGGDISWIIFLIFWTCFLHLFAALQVSPPKIGRPKVQWSFSKDTAMKMGQNSSKFNALRQAAPVTSWFIATPSMITYLPWILYCLVTNQLTYLGGPPRRGPQILYVFASDPANLRIHNDLTRIQILGYIMLYSYIYIIPVDMYMYIIIFTFFLSLWDLVH